MTEQNDNNDFWTDELFFTSQDPLVRKTEEKHHPDTGKRVSIVQHGVAQAIGKLAVQEASGSKEDETKVLKTSKENFSKN